MEAVCVVSLQLKAIGVQALGHCAWPSVAHDCRRLCIIAGDACVVYVATDTGQAKGPLSPYRDYGEEALTERPPGEATRRAR
jgi:hypothetical protein